MCNIQRLSELSHLFDKFSTLCNYFRTVLIWFESIVEKPTHFSFLGSSTSSFFRSRSENDYPL
jgi:hypothetical protein